MIVFDTQVKIMWDTACMDFISHITESQFNRWANHRLHISYLVHFNLHVP